MSVVRLFRDAAFDEDTIEILDRAYDLASNLLHDRNRRPAIVNDVIAERIVALAEEGERDPERLAAAAIEGFGIIRR